ncbi:NACHT N-terminal Helical domain 1-containing protein [Nocardiopsis valliformis]|uniref:NACHT N-terminal Helical domain 1-containing protein n=1 Tax=Nocardiopsis valliformis TaxID=239974 RepID=UPI00373AF1F9
MAWEAAALKAAGTVGSRAGRRWLAQRSAAADRGRDLTELIRVNFRDGIARRKVQHQLDGIVPAVMQRLQPLCEQEFRGLDDATRPRCQQSWPTSWSARTRPAKWSQGATGICATSILIPSGSSTKTAK